MEVSNSTRTFCPSLNSHILARVSYLLFGVAALLQGFHGTDAEPPVRGTEIPGAGGRCLWFQHPSLVPPTLLSRLGGVHVDCAPTQAQRETISMNPGGYP